MLGLPLGAVLAFYFGWGLHGLWAGMLCAVMAHVVSFLIIVARLDWTKQAALAAELEVTETEKDKETVSEQRGLLQ